MFYQLSLMDPIGLDKVFKENPAITEVIHFAGLKVRMAPPELSL